MNTNKSYDQNIMDREEPGSPTYTSSHPHTPETQSLRQNHDTLINSPTTSRLERWSGHAPSDRLKDDEMKILRSSSLVAPKADGTWLGSPINVEKSWDDERNLPKLLNGEEFQPPSQTRHVQSSTPKRTKSPQRSYPYSNTERISHHRSGEEVNPDSRQYSAPINNLPHHQMSQGSTRYAHDMGSHMSHQSGSDMLSDQMQNLMLRENHIPMSMGNQSLPQWSQTPPNPYSDFNPHQSPLNVPYQQQNHNVYNGPTQPSSRMFSVKSQQPLQSSARLDNPLGVPLPEVGVDASALAYEQLAQYYASRAAEMMSLRGGTQQRMPSSGLYSQIPRVFPQIMPTSAEAFEAASEPQCFDVEFKAGRVDTCWAPALDGYQPGEFVFVEADRGKDLGLIIQQVAAPDPTYIDADDKSKPTAGSAGRSLSDLTKIIRRALSSELSQLGQKAQDEAKALALCQQKVAQRLMPMEVVDAEYQFDRRKLTFYFRANHRIDFRELIRDLFKDDG